MPGCFFLFFFWSSIHLPNKYGTLYSLFIFLFHLLGPLVLANAHFLPRPLWFRWDTLPCISIPVSSPFFKSSSRISTMVFIVCFYIPLHQLQFWVTEVITFCIGGSGEQEYARPRAAYLSNAKRLDSSKSHRNCAMHSSTVKCWPIE